MSRKRLLRPEDLWNAVLQAPDPNPLQDRVSGTELRDACTEAVYGEATEAELHESMEQAVTDWGGAFRDGQRLVGGIIELADGRRVYAVVLDHEVDL